MKKVAIVIIALGLGFASCNKKKSCICIASSNGVVLGQSKQTTTGECSALSLTKTDAGVVTSLKCFNE